MKNHNTEIALVVGHYPHSGAEGEWEWNKKCGEYMQQRLEGLGFKVYLHIHAIRGYGARQDAMREAVKDNLPYCKAVIELHYNDADSEQAHGHEFLYNATPKLAECLQGSFKKSFPESTARDGGTKQRSTGDGAGFLIKAPAASCIVEPFFRHNQAEWEQFSEAWQKVGDTYIAGICDYTGISYEQDKPQKDDLTLESLDARVKELERILKPR